MELIFEIGAEELPPASVRPALEDLRSSVTGELERAGIDHGELQVFGTPRRLVLTIRDLAEKARDSRDTVFGPPASAAYDQAGNPTQAAVGFAKSQGVEVCDLKKAAKGKGEYVCVDKLQEGAPTVEHLNLMFREAIGAGIRFPKTMRWPLKDTRSERQVRFARPIRWLVLVINDKPGTDSSGDPFSWAGIVAGSTTRGHRFLGSSAIAVTSIDEYVEDLKRNFVIVDHEERKQLIRELIDRAATSAGGKVVEDEELLERVTFTVEYPLAVLGSFSPKFLEMPGEVVVTALKEHQDFFSVGAPDGKLMPKFIAVANIDEDRVGKIKSGNERVLKARLDDAHFYWEQDLKDGLDAMAERLKAVIWQEQLGTVMDKSRRLAELSRVISKITGLSDADLTGRAAQLCKADLTSLMVREKEFSSLQGLMGKAYAAAACEAPEVAEAILEHYLPRFAGDILPSTPTGTVLALADKIDTLVGCFGIELIPTGSQDPYGLRRQATGFVRILMERGIHLGVADAVSEAYRLYDAGLPVSDHVVSEQLLGFLGQRVETLLVDGGERRDMVAAVVAVGIDDPALLTKRLSAVKTFEQDERFGTLVTAFKRAYNITKGEIEGEIDKGLLQDEAESDLYGAYESIHHKFNNLIYEQNFASALALLLELSVPIDVFFDQVMVMVDDERLRQNRLNMLGHITDLFLQIADFSRMEVG